MKRLLCYWSGALLLIVCWAQSSVLAGPARDRHEPDASVLAQLEQEHGTIEAYTDETTGTPAYLHGQLAQTSADQPLRSAYDFFNEYGAAWGLSEPARELKLVEQTHDQLGHTSLRFEQHVGKVPVLTTDLQVHIGPTGMLHTVNGRLLPHVQPSTVQPKLSSSTAVQRATKLAGGQLQDQPRLGIGRIENHDYLVWELWLFDAAQPARWQIWVDALDGTVRQQTNILGKARDRQTYDADGKEVLPGNLIRAEAQAATTDDSINVAHDHAGIVYDYFLSQFGRDSIDGAGMPIVSTVHFGKKYNNAFWNGSQMVYGDGDGELYAPLAQALDVVAHELTHGITDHTAKLEYKDQPGALNESFSDIFALLIDSANWDLAEAVYTPNVPGDALRSAADPTRYGDPSVWGEYLRTPWDSGGVHSNSGILNHLAYQVIRAIGRDEAAQIFYRTLTLKLTANSDFVVARDLTIQACTELIGTANIRPADCEAVRTAFVRSGIGISSTKPPIITSSYQVYLPVIAQQASGLSAQLSTPSLPACGTELIRNGGFEDGQTGWPTDDADNTVGDDYTKRTGNRSAKLIGGYQMLQWVQLPAHATTARIQIYINRAPGRVPADQPTMIIRTETSDGVTVSTVATLRSNDALNRWQLVTQTIDVSTLRDLRLVFAGRYGTFTIDDVSIVALCGA